MLSSVTCSEDVLSAALSPVSKIQAHRAPIPEEEPLPGEEPDPEEEELPPHPDPVMGLPQPHKRS